MHHAAIFFRLMTVDKCFPLCLLARFFTDNPSFPALHVAFGLSLERFIQILGSDLWMHSLRSRWTDVFSKWGITNPADVWDNRKIYGTEAGVGTKQVRWVIFFKAQAMLLSPWTSTLAHLPSLTSVCLVFLCVERGESLRTGRRTQLLLCAGSYSDFLRAFF